MVKKENPQLLFDVLLAEALNENAQPLPVKTAQELALKQEPTPKNKDTETEELSPSEVKRLKLQKVKERYTAYCTEWLLGVHFRVRMLSNFVPHSDKILPLHQTEVFGKKYTFFSALVEAKEFQGAELFLNYPPVKKLLETDKKSALLNLKPVHQTLKEELLAQRKYKHITGFSNQAFKSFWQELKRQYPLPNLLQQILFDADETEPLDIHKKARFDKKSNPQTAFSFLVTSGLMAEALDYLYALPNGVTIGDMCNLVNDKKAKEEMNFLTHKKIYRGSEEALFFSTLEQALPSRVFLKFVTQKEPHTPYKETDMLDKNETVSSYLRAKNKLGTQER